MLLQKRFHKKCDILRKISAIGAFEICIENMPKVSATCKQKLYHKGREWDVVSGSVHN